MMKKKENRSVNIPMVVKVMGWLVMIEGGFMLFPTAAAFFFGDAEFNAFAVSAAVTFLSGFAMTNGIRPSSTRMNKREGFLLTAMVWVVFSFFGMMPFLMSPVDISVGAAYFEAMSGFTTTGATVIDNVAGLSRSIHLWRALMQWIGGMGIILFTLAVIPMLNHSGGMQMFNAEVTGITHDKIRPRISQTAKSLWGIYILLTVACALLLWAGPMDWFDSICHAFGTVSTGGCSTVDDGVDAWSSPYVLGVVTLFMFLGGVNFTLLFRVASGHPGALAANTTFRVYIFSIVAYFALFVAAIAYNGCLDTWQDGTLRPLFQVVSAITSTGYTVGQFPTWGYFTVALMFLIMFFGACAGSTAGGAKLDRMIVLFKFVRNEMYRALQPNHVTAVQVGKHAVPQDLVLKVVAFLCIYAMLMALGGIILSAMGMPMVDAFFSSFSCVSNVGLGASVTGYGGSFKHIPDGGLWLLSLLMLTGRLEIFTILMLFLPAFWRR